MTSWWRHDNLLKIFNIIDYGILTMPLGKSVSSACGGGKQNLGEEGYTYKTSINAL